LKGKGKKGEKTPLFYLSHEGKTRTNGILFDERGKKKGKKDV